MSRVKTCTYCAQEIPRDAGVCRYCHRAQPSRAPVIGGPWSRKRKPQNTLVAVIASAAVVVMMFATRWERGTFREQPKKALDIGGARSVAGINVTSRETETLSNCAVLLHGQWRADIATLSPMKVEILEWEEFRNADGKVLSEEQGRAVRYAAVTCASHAQSRRAAAIAFR